MKIFLSLILCFATLTISSAQEPTLKVVSEGFVFGDERPFDQCHASTLESLGDGQFMIAWFAGTEEKADDVGIWISNGRDGDWTAPELVAKVREDAHWNPVLFNAPDGKLYLYFKVGKEIDHWETWVMESRDNGSTWSEPVELVEGDRGGRGPVRNHVLVLFDGTWLAPASLEKNRVWNAFVDRSEDEGKTWVNSETLILDREKIPGEGVIQPALWESAALYVHMLLRTSAGKIGRSDSHDGGLTWSPVELTDLPNNNSGIDIAHISGDTLALIYNPVGENWGKRYPMELAVSYDNGKTWPLKQVIEEGNGQDEFSYPSILYDNGELVFCYTWNREKIKFVRVKLEEQ
jgi:predicted neuraminidase